MTTSAGRIILESQVRYNGFKTGEMPTSMGRDFGNETREAH